MGKTGAAPMIRKLAVQNPELTHAEIARVVGCTPQNVDCVLDTFLGKYSRDQLQDYQANTADVFDSLGYRMLSSITQDKIDKTKPMEAVTAAAILFDKSRLVRGQATGINVNVMLDLVEAIKAKSNQ
jgi:hypothetical protein